MWTDDDLSQNARKLKKLNKFKKKTNNSFHKHDCIVKYKMAVK